MVTEVLQGFRSDAGYKKAKSLLQTLTVFEFVGMKRAIKAAENLRTLRKQGITVRKTIDTLIATFCIEEGYPLLFADQDFQPFVEHLGHCRCLKTSNISVQLH